MGNRRTDRLVLTVCAIAALAVCAVVAAQDQLQSAQQPPAYGQFLADSFVSPLPPVDQPAARLASFPTDMTEPLLGDSDRSMLLPESQEMKKPPGRDGVFQRVSLTGTYLPRLGTDNVGFTDLDTYAVFGFPLPTRESPLLITAGTDFWWVDRSVGADLPQNLYDNYLEFRWLSKITPRFGVDLAVTPGWHSDYYNDNGADSYRTVAHGVGAYDWTPNLKIALGIVYLDRDDVQMLPAGGIIWTPNDDIRFELVTPRPKIAWRYACEACGDNWVYVAGEFGGGQWGIETAGGLENVLTARDYRLILGIEYKSKVLGLNSRAEIGYVFGRVLEYRSALPDVDLPDTMMARVGASY